MRSIDRTDEKFSVSFPFLFFDLPVLHPRTFFRAGEERSEMAGNTN